MPDYNVTAPDGTKYKVTAPEGATQDEIIAYAQQQHSQPITGARPVAEGRGVIDQLLGQTGPRYQLAPERMARGIGSVIKNLIDSAKVAPPGTPESVEAEAGPAFEAAKIFTPLSRGGITTAAALPKAPTQEALRDVIKEQYGELDKSGIQIPQKDVAQLAKDIRQDLMHGENRGHRPLNQPGTFGALDELEQAPGRFTDIDSVRQVLNKVRMDIGKNKSDAQAAGVAIGKIDDFLSSRTGETGALAKSARGNVSALKKSEQITANRESSEMSAATTGSRANLANRLKQNIRQIVDPKYPQRQIGYKPAEIEMMKAIVGGGGRYSPEHIMQIIGKLGPDHPLSGWGGALLSGKGMVTMPIGAVAQWLSEKMVLGKIERLDQMIRSRAPAAKDLATPRAKPNPLTALYARGAVPAVGYATSAPDQYQKQQLQDLGL